MLITKKPLKILFFLCSLLAFIQGCAIQKNNIIKSANNDIVPIPFIPTTHWKKRNFYQATEYKIEKNDGQTVLQANSSKSASLLYRKIHIDLTKTPYLNWRWKVNNILKNNFQEKQKKGDDFAARIYIAIKPEFGEFKPRALTYVWASNIEPFDTWKNPYSKSVGMIAIKSGDHHLERWFSEKRNLRKDLSKFFDEPINAIQGIAVMTDTDNTKEHATAAYADLFFSAK